MKKFVTLLVITAINLTIAFAQTTQWGIDASHSNITFVATHMVISEVSGKFNTFDAKVTTEGDNLEGAQVTFSAEIASIDTDNEMRDNHLKSEDFFDAENHPQLTFKSTSFKKTGKNTYKMVGDLTIRGTTKQVSLDVTHGGTVNDPWGNTKAGFKVKGVINRFDYGLKWNTAVETGGLVVGEDIELNLNVELTKQNNG